MVAKSTLVKNGHPIRPKAKPVDWTAIERLCLRSFTGGGLSDDEQSVLQDAYRRFPEEYAVRTQATRDEERARIKGM